jgi:hypothetical protein
VDTVVEFGESLAVKALGESIDGRLASRDLIDHFLERRAELEAATKEIDKGHPLSEALFWPQ